MIVYPAIDLRGGRCVRLMQGEFDRETVYGDDPVAVARTWAAAGAAVARTSNPSARTVRTVLMTSLSVADGMGERKATWPC